MTQPSRLQPVIRETSVALLFVALTLAMTWPLVRNFSTAVSDPGDPYLVVWILDWSHWAMTHDPLSLFHAPIFHPARFTLAFSENLFGIALVTLPFYLAGCTPVAIYNIAVVLGFAFSGYGMYVLARYLTRSTYAAIIAGIFFAFVPFRFDHLSHLQHIWSGWLPILLWALFRYFDRPGWRTALQFSAAFVLNGLTNIHWFVFGAFTVGVSALVLLLIQRKLTEWRLWWRLALATLLAIAVLLPFLLPYRHVAKTYKMKRGREETLAYSATPADWLVPTLRSRTYGNLNIVANGKPERALFPGLLVLLLSVAGLFLGSRKLSGEKADASTVEARDEGAHSPPGPAALRWLDATLVLLAVAMYFAIAARIDTQIGPLRFRSHGAHLPATLFFVLLLTRWWIRLPAIWGGDHGNSLARVVRRPSRPVWIWIASLWVVFGFLGSLGLNAFFHQFLFLKIEVFRSIRVPSRWSMIAYVGLAMLAAAGTVALLRTARPWRSRGIAILLSLAFLLELRAAPIRWHIVVPEAPPVYAWIASSGIRGAVLELPLRQDQAYEYQLRSTQHHKPLINGVSGFEPPVSRHINWLYEQPLIPDQLWSVLEKIGCSVVIVHIDELSDRTHVIRDWLRRGIAGGRISFVRFLDHSVSGDLVFALSRNEPQPARWQAPDTPDVFGRTEPDNLELFLAGEQTISRTTMGRLVAPKFDDDVRGRFRMHGWAMSPHGIRRIDLRLGNGAVILPTRLTPAPPGYPGEPRVSVVTFETVVPNRPAGLTAETDVQVEITDSRGVRTRLGDVWFRWIRGAGSLEIQPGEWKPGQLEALLTRLKAPETAAGRVRGGSARVHEFTAKLRRDLQSAPDPLFIDGLFRALLERAPDAAALDTYQTQLARGRTRDQVIEAVIESKEFRDKYTR